MPKNIAIQGFEGSFHQIAARSYFGRKIETLPCDSFTKVVNSVSSGKADAGMMAIENSTAGSILPNYDLLQRSDLFIVGEIYLHIRQHLMVLPDVDLGDIKEVHSHPMALLQCRDYLERYPEWRLIETEDTALSAQHLRDFNRVHTAAIASDLAAELFDLKIVQPDINTEKRNYTRFLVLSKQKKHKDIENDHKASLYFHVLDKAGHLGRVLNCIGEEEINISKLQSFPIPELPWEYYFHADLEFAKMEQFDNVIECIKPLTKQLRILGIYNKGITI